MKKTLKAALTLLFLATTACTHYTTATRPDTMNIINAPIDTVWETALQILPNERMTLNSVNKENYTIVATKHITWWSWADDVNMRLLQKGENQTIVILMAATKGPQLTALGHEARMVNYLFNKIKKQAEDIANNSK